ncbi:delta(3,5)-Delta(2,4)-dienoyl-CoA isomerase [Carex littledalei]|uniref:Delta(3,5)-Delta(2,4)-dienoyl-CoA isomerase n=1 Tax=Carex littledalei TaxID=544730 RepID=A0A833QGK2_9POAL|nr:delta(3,5)-Delta(2,4)-dienoyl-CoA isomerase [Carex littledalei]
MDPAQAEAELAKGFSTIEVIRPDRSEGVYQVWLNRPSRRNALSLDFFSELPRALSLLDCIPSARVIVLSGRGPHFCSGIEVSALVATVPSEPADVATRSESLRRKILVLQDSISAVEKCRKPVIVAVHGACVGGGVDLIAACDIRCCEQGAFFQVKEVDLGLAADLGTLQRLPAIVGFGNAIELALTARRLYAAEAKQMGLISRVFSSPEDLEKGALQIARDLAEKSAVAIMGTKAAMLKSRDLTVQQGLEHIATWNSAMLMSSDLEEAVKASLEKRKPVFFSKL